ncbi:transmembrane protein, putative [Bodo saltans]|uniref:Transmembrane protein, putative n=1 Tax=Bodo saltans TaxID=75058 RepID=A0A0S4JL79_BODSA|nr:transmembrane protein, putative [Bodo saltans]|eukprot:CUG90875.1 transmembrane protein, putative [Bodo saltans]
MLKKMQTNRDAFFGLMVKALFASNVMKVIVGNAEKKSLQTTIYLLLLQMLASTLTVEVSAYVLLG